MDKQTGPGSVAWAPSLGGEGSRNKSADTSFTTKVEHKTSKFGDTVKFGNRKGRKLVDILPHQG